MIGLRIPRVGVIDSGWRSPPHPRVAPGRNFVPSDPELPPSVPNEVDDRIGHGTAIGRIILGCSAATLIVPVKIFDRKLHASHQTLFAALEWAQSQHLTLLNLSLTTIDLSARDQLYVICEHLLESGTIVVAAGLNGTGIGFPAVFANTIGVSLSGPPVGTSASGAHRPDTDFSLSPSALKTCIRAMGGSPHASTSLAAAVVTGIAASLIERNGMLALDDLKERIRSRLLAMNLIAPD